MSAHPFNLSFYVKQTPEQVYAAVNNVRGWWSTLLKGDSLQVNDEFEYRHKDIHYSKHRVIEQVPGQKVVWLVLDSHLSFVPKGDEWTGTKNIFLITREGEQTKLEFIHEGLVPSCECYQGCSGGWTHYLTQSLLPLIETGLGKPDQ